MSIEKLTENVEIIQTLGTFPNQDDGLTPEELKIKFDEGAKVIKNYLNDVVVPAVNDALNKPVTPGPAGPQEAILFTPQPDLTEVQKAQARENIDAVTVAEVEAIITANLSVIVNAEEVAY